MAEPAFLLDANICVYLLGGNAPALLARVQDCAPGEIVTSAIAFAEVMVGASRRDATGAARQFFRAIPVIPFDDKAGFSYAEIPFKRRNFDRLIAAHALALGLTLVTNNQRDFLDIPGLKVDNWQIT